MSRSPLSILLVALALPAAALGCALAGAAADTPEIRAPAPLSEGERERALALAAGAREEYRETSDEPRVDGTEITDEIVSAVALYPPTDASDRRRLAAVTSFDYASGLATRVVVDLGAERALEVRRLPGSAAPASAEEEARVRRLLTADSPAYRALFDAPADAYDLALFVSTGADGDELAGHRIVLVRPVYFRPAPKAPIAIVDLSTNAVLRYENGDGAEEVKR